jgi:hypothetical protein
MKKNFFVRRACLPATGNKEVKTSYPINILYEKIPPVYNVAVSDDENNWSRQL